MASLNDQHTSLSLSEDDDIGNDPSSSKQQNVKRGSRACDRCRKIKSKCEAGTATEDKCKNCEVANTPCTFQGPSFKRGPPKGYIHSIEQRWHQVECILATIMETPRAQDIIGDLRSDPFASAILDRVQRGPYGSGSRLHRQDNNSEPYASLAEVPEYTPMRDDRRSRRQSRVSREIVSQDPTVSATPTREWQDQLARKLQNYSWAYTASQLSPTSRPSSAGASVDYSRTRRKLDYPSSIPAQHSWDNLYTLPDTQSGFEPGHVNETAEAFGHLSVDQNQEFRYHGPASGLPLLAQSNRKTGGNHQQQDRIWKFMTNVDPQSTTHDLAEEEFIAVDIPSPETQNYLLQLYFTYVHPFFPVVHKQDFLFHYNAVSAPSAPRASFGPQPLQRPGKMLLLAMFAIAARYSDKPEVHMMTHGENSVSRAGQKYAEDAHRLLDKKYQSSRPSTCQALLLLAIREFGMGAMDKGWLYSASMLEGMALRMAVDLGMNRNADSWTTDGKQPVFTDIEKQIRKHIWWSCCTSDKLSAVWLGRPITFRANDHSTPIPDIYEVDEEEPWHPYPPGVKGEYVPQPSMLMTTFRQACQLSVIITDVMDNIYPVQSESRTSPRTLFEQLETRLNKWFIGLPEQLRFSPNDKSAAVLPHVLILHIEYHAAVLLLHRAFLPPDEPSPQANLQSDPLALKAFDVCSGAASQICSLAVIYDERFGLDKAPPFLCIYLQAAGIMHVITLSRRPWDPQATLGLNRCIEACKKMERLWPTAGRLRALLEGAKVHLDESTYASQSSSRKRSVEDALGSSKNLDTSAPEMYSMPAVEGYSRSPSTSTAWDPAHSARMVAHTLGIAGPSAEASSFYPGYQWWPSRLLTTEGLTHMTLSAPVDPMSYDPMPSYSHPPQHLPPHSQPPTSHPPFTFDQGNLSSNFVQGVHDVSYPGYNYSRYNEHPDPRQESRQ